ncbi:MAG: hypothetical protein RSE41_11050 [Clostridia bacterium]
MKNLFKKLLALTLILSMGIASTPSFATENNDLIPTYNSIEEWEESGDTYERVRIQNNKNRYLGGYTEYKYVSSKFNDDTRVGYHPDFSGWNYWDGYYFSTSSKTSFSPSISFAWGKVSVGVSVAKSSKGSGTYKKADGNRRSRPWVRADITTKIYDIYIYDDYGKLLSINREGRKVATSSDVQIFIDHQ